MGVSYRSVDGRAELEVVGPVTTEDVRESLHAALAQPDIAVPVQLLIDVTHSELVPDQDGLRSIASLIAADFGERGGRVAVHVAEELRFGLARQIGAFLESYDINARPFWERLEAESWLAAAGSS